MCVCVSVCVCVREREREVKVKVNVFQSLNKHPVGRISNKSCMILLVKRYMGDGRFGKIFGMSLSLVTEPLESLRYFLLIRLVYGTNRSLTRYGRFG